MRAKPQGISSLLDASCASRGSGSAAGRDSGLPERGSRQTCPARFAGKHSELWAKHKIEGCADRLPPYHRCSMIHIENDFDSLRNQRHIEGDFISGRFVVGDDGDMSGDRPEGNTHI